RLDRVDVASGVRRNETCGPSIVPMQPHGRALPFGITLCAPNQVSREDVMAVAHDVCPNIDPLARHSLRRKTAGVDARIDVLDQKPASGKSANGSNAHSSTHLSMPEASDAQ